MMGVREWTSSHVGAIVAALVVLAFVVAGSVARCTAIHAPDEAERQTPEDIADDELSDELKSLRRGYSDTTKEALGLLAANVWVDESDTSVVTFTDRAILTRAQGDESWEAYAVMTSAKRTPNSSENATVTTLCLQTPEWCELATVTVPSSTDSEGTPALPTFWCPDVCGGSVLTLSPALKEVEVNGPPEALLAAQGISQEVVRVTLAQWCATWRPTATMATWDQTVEADYEARTTKIAYKLDDRRGTTATLSISMDDGSISVEEGER